MTSLSNMPGFFLFVQLTRVVPRIVLTLCVSFDISSSDLVLTFGAQCCQVYWERHTLNNQNNNFLLTTGILPSYPRRASHDRSLTKCGTGSPKPAVSSDWKYPASLSDWYLNRTFLMQTLRSRFWQNVLLRLDCLNTYTGMQYTFLAHTSPFGNHVPETVQTLKLPSYNFEYFQCRCRQTFQSLSCFLCQSRVF